MEKSNIPTASQKSCNDCKFCETLTSIQHGRTVQLCRLKPPVAMAALVMSPNGPGWSEYTSWPQVGPSDWCNEWRARLQ